MKLEILNQKVKLFTKKIEKIQKIDKKIVFELVKQFNQILKFNKYFKKYPNQKKYLLLVKS